MLENVATGILSRVVKVSGFFTSSIVNSKVGKKFFSLALSFLPWMDSNLGLNGSIDLESFKACVPLVTHKDLEPYIQRIADSDTSPILTGKAITTISLREWSQRRK
ncbi:hypothetical protein LWI29_016764 [Acer saccharum]|uniref:Uncharacterized protein n=1 Tax=Acer saccharum TaxID=4024 RepID=A0AA39SGE0_ACESA|nr:hypothetical protein LWI29_016764 [Acer saccharum]